MRLSSISLGLLPLLVACGANPKDGEPLRLEWKQGETWHVAARSLNTAAGGAETPVDLEGGLVSPSFEAETWGEELIWTYQVVETGLVPSPGDELYPFAARGRQVLPLTVLKASLEADLNEGSSALDEDPVVYLVFREDTDRLSAIVEFRTVDGQRTERALATSRPGRSWSILSQASLSLAPTWLAPSAARWEDGTRRLEAGRAVQSARVGRDQLDVWYQDELGGGEVLSRYQAGKPWPVETVSDNAVARLLDESELEGRRAPGAATARSAAADFDYKTALKGKVDIETALSLSAADIESGGYLAQAYDGYLPWAGSWWPLKKAELVWGYDGRATYSGRIKEKVDPLKKEMDELSAALRTLDKSGSEYQDKLKSYQDKQAALVDVLVAFYDGLRADLDGGLITLADGKLVHAGGGQVGESGWSYKLEQLSPMDKTALVFYTEKKVSGNPFYLPAWEILNSYNPKGEGWWGHCNGWAAAAILTTEPRQPVSTTTRGQTVEFTVADLKGLLTEAHYSTWSHFYGQRYNGPDEDITDLSPMAFQRLVDFYLRTQGVGFVFDTTAGAEVWNFPVWMVELQIDETTPARDEVPVDLNTASAEELASILPLSMEEAEAIVAWREDEGPFQSVDELAQVPGFDADTVEALAEWITVEPRTRSFEVRAEATLTSDGVDVSHIDGSSPESFTEVWSYSLTTDPSGLVIEGRWAREDEHPDFAWVPYGNTRSAERSGGENPYLPYGKLLEIIGESFERK